LPIGGTEADADERSESRERGKEAERSDAGQEGAEGTRRKRPAKPAGRRHGRCRVWQGRQVYSRYGEKGGEAAVARAERQPRLVQNWQRQ